MTCRLTAFCCLAVLVSCGGQPEPAESAVPTSAPAASAADGVAAMPAACPPGLPLAEVLRHRGPREAIPLFAVGDVDADGNTDLATVDAPRRTVQVYLGNGEGSWSPDASLQCTGEITAIAADYDVVVAAQPSAGPPVILRFSRRAQGPSASWLPQAPAGISLITTIAHMVRSSTHTGRGVTFEMNRNELWAFGGTGGASPYATGCCRHEKNGAWNLPLAPPCPLLGEAVFTDLDDDGRWDLLVSGVERGAERPAGSEPVVGTMVYPSAERAPSPGTRYPGWAANLCVPPGQAGTPAVLALGADIRRFDLGKGWTPAGRIPGFLRCAERDLYGPYRRRQVVLAQRDVVLVLLSIDLAHLEETLVGHFPVPAGQRPLHVILPRPDRPESALLLCYDDEAQVLDCVGLKVAAPAAPGRAHGTHL